MKIIKSIISTIVVFTAGLEIGGFSMWYLTMKAINEPRPKHNNRVSYQSYYEKE